LLPIACTLLLKKYKGRFYLLFRQINQTDRPLSDRYNKVPMRRSIPIIAFILALTFVSDASARGAMRPKIISRAEWGADEELLTNSKNGTMSLNASDAGETGRLSDRAKECNDWKRKYPQDFKKTNLVTHDSSGQKLRWAREYSPGVKLLVVHHTALKLAGDDRSPTERMKALYTYHADKIGWGDIGYHFVIDEKGNIFEGRNGGKSVIGGHLYCGNTSTIGIALMGNFEVERPTQNQFRSLKQLLSYLANEYALNLNGKVRFHGKLSSPIVGHKDAGHTKCPGFNLDEVMPQIRSQTAAGKFGSLIISPTSKRRQDSTYARKLSRLTNLEARQPILRTVGSTEIIGRPGSNLYIQLQYIAGESSVPRRARLARVERSSNRIGVWQKINGREILVRKELISPSKIKSRDTQVMQLRIQLPRQARAYQLKIGDLSFTLRAEGRRVPLPESARESRQRTSLVKERATIRESQNQNETITHKAVASSDKTIRIRLSYTNDIIKIETNTLSKVNGQPTGSRNLTLQKEGNKCAVRTPHRNLVPVPTPKHAQQQYVPQPQSAQDRNTGGMYLSRESIRIDPISGTSTITNWPRSANRFRGVIECRVIDNELVLINELPLEQYLWGLAEEPDSEPYEKQRAFAIAARSYAAHYMHPKNVKFPGMPYDGDDSPARFQAYGGLHFEEKNPRWVKAVDSTSGLIISKYGKIVKTPYFSTDDGRTRSPEERGWKGFPFSEVFNSKADPWCKGMKLRGHGVGMSGCGAEGQANEGKKAEEILDYYYRGTEIKGLP